MNKKDFSAVILASILGGAAFVVPVLAEETTADSQEQTTETTAVEDTNVTLNEEEVVKNVFQEIDGYTYYFDNDGNKVFGIQSINGDTYYFDVNGVLQTNVEYEDYYFGQDGRAVKNDWVNLSSGKKYFDENGKVVKSSNESTFMKEINGNTYAFDSDGYMLTGLQEIDGTKYYFDQNGVLVNKNSIGNKLDTVANKANTWFQDKYGNTYYYDENEIIVINCFYEIDGNTYHFNSLGRLDVGVFSADQQLYITNKDGSIQSKKGWQSYNFEWYYVSDDGTLMNNAWLTENGKKYYFMSDGCAATSTSMEIDGITYSFDPNGALTGTLDNFTGWKKFNGEWYYSKNGDANYTGKVGNYYVINGKMAVNQVVAKTYYVDYNGIIQKGWIKKYYENDGSIINWLYANPDTGVLAKNEWLTIGNQKYYFSDVDMVTGIVPVNGVFQNFGADGVWKGKVKPNSWAKNNSGKWIYINENGYISYKRKLSVNGVTYYFNGTGSGTAGDNISLAENCSWFNPDGYMYYWTNATGTGLDKTTGWKKSNDGYYGYVENGKLVIGFKTINGKTYNFNYNGYLARGVKNIDGKVYAYDSNGNAIQSKEGWNAFDDQWFYVKNGLSVKNIEIDGYYINQYGLTCNGLKPVADGNYNVLLTHGRLARNQWVKDKGYWYYGDANGRVVKNRWVGNYYFDQYGHMATNAWIENYYVGSDGLYRPAKWVQTNGKWWYRHTDGSYTRNNFEKIGGKWYYFDANGYMITGWKKVNNTWYYFYGSGIMASNAWVGDYYLEESGAMATNKWIGNYYVGADGKWVK